MVKDSIFVYCLVPVYVKSAAWGRPLSPPTSWLSDPEKTRESLHNSILGLPSKSHRQRGLKRKQVIPYSSGDWRGLEAGRETISSPSLSTCSRDVLGLSSITPSSASVITGHLLSIFPLCPGLESPSVLVLKAHLSF